MNHAESLHHSQLNLVSQWNPVDQWNLVYQWNFVCLDEVPGMELHGPKKLNDI